MKKQLIEINSNLEIWINQSDFAIFMSAAIITVGGSGLILVICALFDKI